jgi:hypothetical protein
MSAWTPEQREAVTAVQVLRLRQATREFTPWTRLSAPVDPADTLLCMRAQSALSGAELGQVHDLTVEQARDVIAWHNPKY